MVIWLSHALLFRVSFPCLWPVVCLIPVCIWRFSPIPAILADRSHLFGSFGLFESPRLLPVAEAEFELAASDVGVVGGREEGRGAVGSVKVQGRLWSVNGFLFSGFARDFRYCFL